MSEAVAAVPFEQRTRGIMLLAGQFAGELETFPRLAGVNGAHLRGRRSQGAEF